MVKGDLLESTEIFLCHQCNCVTTGVAGLALHIFNKYPYSNTYKNRKLQSVPGTIDILGNGLDKRFIVNMYAQINPGLPLLRYKDTAVNRLEYFSLCLEALVTAVGARPVKDRSVAFPWRIGCGLAGGSWSAYYDLIHSISNEIKVVIYKKD